MLPAFEQYRDAADQAEDGSGPGERDCARADHGVNVRRKIADESHMATGQSQLKTEIAEAKALHHGVGASAPSRADESAAPPGLDHGVGSPARVPGARGERAEKIRCSSAGEEKNRKPKRDHADDGEVGKVEILDHTIAEYVDLSADRSGEIFAAGNVAIEGIQRDGRKGKNDAGEIGPRAVAKKADSSKADDYSEESYFVWRPSHERHV